MIDYYIVGDLVSGNEATLVRGSYACVNPHTSKYQ